MDIQNLLKSLYFCLLNIDRCIAGNWNFQKVTSPFTRLYLVESGEGTITHNKTEYELKPGWLYMIPSFALCNYSSPTFLGHYYIHLIPQILGGRDIFKLLEFNFELPAAESDIQLMKRIFTLNPGRKLVNQDPAKYCKSDLIPDSHTADFLCQINSYIETQGILMQLFSRFIKIGGQKRTFSTNQSNIKIRHAVHYINENISKQICLNDLAGICHLSNDYFSRLFLKIMGIRPVEYINRKKIEEAQLQLIYTNDPIEKIALEVGIDNFSYFNRLFKKYSCNTPGEYRSLHRFV
jgi:AraC-like DNA-binding protein